MIVCGLACPLLSTIRLIILGIDPGTTAIGYAVINYIHPSASLKTAGCIDLAHTPIESRLILLHKNLNTIIQTWKPDSAAVEELFFSKNVKTALSVSEARGVIVLTTLLAGITLLEYTPLEVKKIVTGYGKADKEQVEKMVRMTLKEANLLKARDDVFDAIAIALAAAWQTRISTI